MTIIEWPEKYKRTLEVIEFLAKIAGQSVAEYIAEEMHDNLYAWVQDTQGEGLANIVLEHVADDTPEKYEPEKKPEIQTMTKKSH